LISVEGSLIFEDTDLTLDAHYIMNNFGLIQIGTVANPILSKITITMHGTKEGK
jgi:hypothetical protein